MKNTHLMHNYEQIKKKKIQFSSINSKSENFNTIFPQ